MLSPVLVASTDPDREVAIMTVEGPFGDPRHTESLRLALPALPVGYGFVIDLSSASDLTPASLDGLRTLARDARISGQRLIFVCSDLERRAELIVANLDTLAPVVEALEQAIPLAHAA